jgi:hypothetical protein
MDLQYRRPPSGPALDDHATRVALRRYRSGAWLLVVAGVVLLGEVAAETVYELSDPLATSLDDLRDTVTVASLFLGLLLLSGAVIGLVQARRLRRLLGEHAWRAVRYVYAEHVDTIDLVEGPSTTVSGQLSVLDPAAGGTRPRFVNLGHAYTPWRKWRLRTWRQASQGVAWIAGDLSGAVVVALPGPGPLFGARWGRESDIRTA